MEKEHLSYDQTEEIMSCASAEEARLKLEVMYPGTQLNSEDLSGFLSRLCEFPEFAPALVELMESGSFGDSVLEHTFGPDYYLAKSFGAEPDFRSFAHFSVFDPFLQDRLRIYSYRRKTSYTEEQERELVDGIRKVILYMAEKIRNRYGRGIRSVEAVVSRNK